MTTPEIDIMDVVKMVSMGVSTAKNALGFLEAIKKVTGSSVISAYFDWDGTLIEGNKKIKIEKLPAGYSDAWWFKVKELKDYVFVRIPVVDSCLQEIPGQYSGENADADVWRWIPFIEQRAVLSTNHAGNIKVKFVIVGYRPKALLKSFSSKER